MAQQTISLRISGMSCGHCEKSVHTALTALAGVSTAGVDHKAGTATVVFDDTQVTPEQLIAAVNETYVYEATAA
jgi:copper chaperone CopZ